MPETKVIHASHRVIHSVVVSAAISHPAKGDIAERDCRQDESPFE